MALSFVDRERRKVGRFMGGGTHRVLSLIGQDTFLRTSA